MQRINVIGTSGSGKSTFSRVLADRLGAAYIEMDALFWKPGWGKSSDAEMCDKLQAVLVPPCWILDGNFERTTAVKWAKVDVVIWLDYPFALTLWRAIKRACHRAWSKHEIWPDTGNVETFSKTFLSRNSVLWWTIKSFHRNRRRYQAAMQSPEFQHIRFLRFSTPQQTDAFLGTLSTDR